MFAPVLLSKEELLSPPSCSYGLLMSEEVDLRRTYELFIRTAGLLLRLYPSPHFEHFLHSFAHLLAISTCNRSYLP